MKKFLLFVPVCLLVVGLILGGCASDKKYDSQTPPSSPQTPSVPSTPSAPVQDQGPSAPSPVDGELIGSVSCNNRVITATVTNIGALPLEVGTDIEFFVNAAPDFSPGCGKSVLQPGESMVCSTLDETRPNRKSTLLVKANGDQQFRSVVCE